MRTAIVGALGAEMTTPDELFQRLLAAGLGEDDLAEVPEVVDMMPAVVHTEVGLFHLGAVADGTVWTAYVSEEAAEDGVIEVEPHLSPLSWWLLLEAIPAVDDQGRDLGPLECASAERDGEEIDVVTGADGWLDAFAGRWISIAVGSGRLHLAALDGPPAADPAQAEALKAGFSRTATVQPVARPGHPEVVIRFVYGDQAILDALGRDPDVFRAAPIAPLPELYAAAGLQCAESTVLPADADVEALRWWQPREVLMQTYGLDLAAADSVLAVAELGDPGDDGEPGFHGTPEEAAALAAPFTVEHVATALDEELQGRGLVPDEVLAAIDGLAAALGGDLPPGLVLIRSRLRAAVGDAAGADADVTGLVAAGITWKAVALDAAAYAADRSDAPEAWDLLRTAGALSTDLALDEHFDPLWKVGALLKQEVQGYHRRSARATAGRNDPCPCGSGRKYKACHLGREVLTLEERASWLYDKARRFVRTYFPDALDEIAERVLTNFAGDAQRELADELAASPLVADLALCELELFPLFLSLRRSLLPDDEVELAERWIEVPRSLFGLVRIERDTIELHDMTTSERIVVGSIQMSGDTPLGTVLVGRPLPVGDTYRAFGGFMSAPHETVDTVYATVRRGQAVEIAATLGELLQQAAAPAS